MKLEYHGRWLRFRLELFPKREPEGRIRYEPTRDAPGRRRRMLRRIQAGLRPPLTAT